MIVSCPRCGRRCLPAQMSLCLIRVRRGWVDFAVHECLECVAWYRRGRQVVEAPLRVWVDDDGHSYTDREMCRYRGCNVIWVAR